jgi:hypothetical protein
MDKRFSGMVEKMEKRFSGMDEKMDKRFSGMDEKMEKMDKRFSGMEEKIDDVNLNVRKGFSSLHDFDRNRVATMRSIVREVSFSKTKEINCTDGSATMFFAHYQRKVAGVFAPHFNCSGYNPYPQYIFAHEKYDLAIISLCPDEGLNAVDIARTPDIHLGDDVILYGRGHTAEVWKGVLSGHLKERCGAATPWHGNGSAFEGEFLLHSYQHEGLSGSPVSNGCGLVGMAHAYQDSSSGAIFAAVISAKFIRGMMRKFFFKLPDINDKCHKNVTSIPHYPFSSCPNDTVQERMVSSDEIILL